MKRTFIKVVLLSALGLGGCSTNTQDQNTIAGILTGAVAGGFTGNAIAKGNEHGFGIILGVVSGALLGGLMGHSLDSADHNSTYPILSQNPMTNPNAWTDPRTQVTYQMTPTSNLYRINGNPNCRDFHYMSISYKKRNAFDGRACYLSNRHWERV